MDLKPSILFQIIHELSTQAHSIQLLCHLAKVSRSGYYGNGYYVSHFQWTETVFVCHQRLI